MPYTIFPLTSEQKLEERGLTDTNHKITSRYDEPRAMDDLFLHALAGFLFPGETSLPVQMIVSADDSAVSSSSLCYNSLSPTDIIRRARSCIPELKIELGELAAFALAFNLHEACLSWVINSPHRRVLMEAKGYLASGQFLAGAVPLSTISGARLALTSIRSTARSVDNSFLLLSKSWENSSGIKDFLDDVERDNLDELIQSCLALYRKLEDPAYSNKVAQHLKDILPQLSAQNDLTKSLASLAQRGMDNILLVLYQLTRQKMLSGGSGHQNIQRLCDSLTVWRDAATASKVVTIAMLQSFWAISKIARENDVATKSLAEVFASLTSEEFIALRSRLLPIRVQEQAISYCTLPENIEELISYYDLEQYKDRPIATVLSLLSSFTPCLPAYSRSNALPVAQPEDLEQYRQVAQQKSLDNHSLLRIFVAEQIFNQIRLNNIAAPSCLVARSDFNADAGTGAKRWTPEDFALLLALKGNTAPPSSLRFNDEGRPFFSDCSWVLFCGTDDLAVHPCFSSANFVEWFCAYIEQYSIAIPLEELRAVLTHCTSVFSVADTRQALAGSALQFAKTVLLIDDPKPQVEALMACLTNNLNDMNQLLCMINEATRLRSVTTSGDDFIRGKSALFGHWKLADLMRWGPDVLWPRLRDVPNDINTAEDNNGQLPYAVLGMLHTLLQAGQLDANKSYAGLMHDLRDQNLFEIVGLGLANADCSQQILYYSEFLADVLEQNLQQLCNSHRISLGDQFAIDCSAPHSLPAAELLRPTSPETTDSPTDTPVSEYNNATATIDNADNSLDTAPADNPDLTGVNPADLTRQALLLDIAEETNAPEGEDATNQLDDNSSEQNALVDNQGLFSAVSGPNTEDKNLLPQNYEAEKDASDIRPNIENPITCLAAETQTDVTSNLDTKPSNLITLHALSQSEEDLCPALSIAPVAESVDQVDGQSSNCLDILPILAGDALQATGAFAAFNQAATLGLATGTSSPDAFAVMDYVAGDNPRLLDNLAALEIAKLLAPHQMLPELYKKGHRMHLIYSAGAPLTSSMAIVLALTLGADPSTIVPANNLFDLTDAGEVNAVKSGDSWYKLADSLDGLGCYSAIRQDSYCAQHSDAFTMLPDLTAMEATSAGTLLHRDPCTASFVAKLQQCFLSGLPEPSIPDFLGALQLYYDKICSQQFRDQVSSVAQKWASEERTGEFLSLDNLLPALQSSLDNLQGTTARRLHQMIELLSCAPVSAKLSEVLTWGPFLAIIKNKVNNQGIPSLKFIQQKQHLAGVKTRDLFLLALLQERSSDRTKLLAHHERNATGNQSAANEDQRWAEYTQKLLAGELYSNAIIKVCYGNYGLSIMQMFDTLEGIPDKGGVLGDPDCTKSLLELYSTYLVEETAISYCATSPSATLTDADSPRTAEDYQYIPT